MKDLGSTMGPSLGWVVFAGTIVLLWVLAQFVTRQADRANKTSRKMRRAERRALAVVRRDPTSEGAFDAWQDVLLQGRELQNDFVSGKAFVVLASICLQRKEFDKCLSFCNGATQLLHTEETRELLASVLFTKALAAQKLAQDEVSEEALLQALRLNREIPNLGGELDILNHLGTTYHRSGKRSDAEKYYKLALDLAVETGDRHGEARALHNLGTLAHQNGELDDSLNFLRRALDIKRQISEATAFETMNNIGSIHYQRGEWGLAENIWSDALTEAKKIGKPAPTLLGNIAELKFTRGESLEAIGLRKAALNIREEAGDQSTIAQQLASIAGWYIATGEFEQGREYCERSLKIADSTQNSKLQASGLLNLSTYHSKVGDLGQAIALGERALTLHNEAGDRKNVVVALNNLAGYARLRGDFAKAYTLLAEAQRIAENLHHSRLRAAVLSSIGILKKDTGEPRSGLALLMEATRIREACQDLRHECSSLANAASIEIDLGQLEQALNHANRAADLAGRTSHKEAEVIALLLVGGVYRERGELEKAKEITEQAAGLASQAGVVLNVLWARKNMGVISVYRGEFDTAISDLADAAQEAHRHEYYLLEAMMLTDLSSAEIGSGDVAKATARAEATLKIGESMGAKFVVASSWHWIGTARQQLKQYDSALTAFRHSLVMREAIEHCRGKADTYRKLAEVHLAIGDVVGARENYRSCLDAFRYLGNRSLVQQVESDFNASGL